MQIYNGLQVDSFVEWMFHDQPQEAQTSITASLQDVMQDVVGPQGFLGIRIDITNELAVVGYVMLYPGKLAVITGPVLSGDRRTCNHEQVSLEAANLCSTLAQLAIQNWSVEMVQATVPFESEFESTALRSAGFRYLATLHQLVMILPRMEASSAVGDSSDWQRVHESDLPLVLDWLNATYKDTLDCPELSNLRSTPNALQGYWKLATGSNCRRIVGELVTLPVWWMKLDRSDNLPKPCIQAAYMLTPIQHATWELTYFGVAWQYRKQGLGKSMLEHVLKYLTDLKTRQLFAYVDSRNDPAIKLYDQAGFRLAGSWNAWHYPIPS